MSKLTSRINIFPIVTQYLSTFRAYKSQKYDQSSVLLFFLLPLSVGIYLPVAGITIDDSFSSLLLGLYSVFAGLLFGTQIFIFDIVSKVVELKLTVQASKLRISKFEYLSSVVSFEIFVCFIGLIALFMLKLFHQKMAELIISGISFYLLTLFLLSLLSAVKGVNVLLLEEIEIQRDAVDKKFSNSN